MPCSSGLSVSSCTLISSSWWMKVLHNFTFAFFTCDPSKLSSTVWKFAVIKVCKSNFTEVSLRVTCSACKLTFSSNILHCASHLTESPPDKGKAYGQVSTIFTCHTNCEFSRLLMDIPDALLAYHYTTHSKAPQDNVILQEGVEDKFWEWYTHQ